MRCVDRWCRAENLAHSLRNGTESMWVATGPTPEECQAQADNLAFLSSNLRVFQGEATVEADKTSLVPAVLGLYAELYALALHHDVTDAVQPRPRRLGDVAAARLVPLRWNAPLPPHR